MRQDFSKLILNRIITYLTTKAIIFIPLIVILLYFARYKEIFYSNAENSGWAFIACALESLFLPSVGYYFYDAIARKFFLAIAYTTSLITVSFITLDCLTSMLFLNRLYEKKFKVKLERVNSYGKVSVWRIVVRTIIKYITIIFAPPLLLFPLLNKRRLFLHEIVSRVCKVEVRQEERIEQGLYSKEDEGIVFKEDFSDYEEQ